MHPLSDTTQDDSPHPTLRIQRNQKMIHNWIANVNRELYQSRRRPDHFVHPISNVFSPPESCDETSQTDIITPPPTPRGWVEYPTPPPSRNDTPYPTQPSPQETYATFQFTESITPREDVQLPECLDFILDHPFVGPKFENVAEAKAFLLSSLEEFRSTTDPIHPVYVDTSHQCLFPVRSPAAFSDNSQMYPLSVSPANSLRMWDDDPAMSPPQNPRFETFEDAKEYILNAVEEYYATMSPNETMLSDSSMGACSMTTEDAASYQLTTQYLINAENFIHEPSNSNPWR